MKRILLVMLLSLNAFAVDYGIEVSSKISKIKDKNILGIQRIKELVGDGGTEYGIEYYLKVKDWSNVGLRYTNLPEYKDHKFEITWKMFSKKRKGAFQWYANGGFGYGFQESRTSYISTNITRTNYIFSTDLEQYKVRTKADIDSLNYLSFSIGGGGIYHFTDNFKFFAGYEFERKSVSISYTVEGKTEVIDMSGFNANYHGFRAGLVYKF